MPFFRHQCRVQTEFHRHDLSPSFITQTGVRVVTPYYRGMKRKEVAPGERIADARLRALTSENPRAQATKRRLVAAIRELATDGSAAPITASLVARRAGVARSSFYAHFSDSAELAAFALREDLGRLGDEAFDIGAVAGRTGRVTTRETLGELIRQLDVYVPIFHRLGALPLDRSAAELLTGEFTASVRVSIRARRPGIAAETLDIAASFLTGGILGAYASARAGADFTESNREQLVAEIMNWLPAWIVDPAESGTAQEPVM